MKYTIEQFNNDFPNDNACLWFLFRKKYDGVDNGWHKIPNRPLFQNKQGKQISPMANTIFEKSPTPLRLWFYAIFLFSNSKNGVSAKELERQLGVTYKTAWRMAKQIRLLMAQGDLELKDTVEVDETYIGGYHRQKGKFDNKTPVIGMVERKGRIKAKKIPNRETHTVLNEVQDTISKDAIVMSDEYSAYKKLNRLGYRSHRVKHGKGTYVLGDIHTNTIEGFWGQLKRGITGTYHHASQKYLQHYVDEFAFRYNVRHSPYSVFEEMIGRV